LKWKLEKEKYLFFWNVDLLWWMKNTTDKKKSSEITALSIVYYCAW
jgi:hypothetical protein